MDNWNKIYYVQKYYRNYIVIIFLITFYRLKISGHFIDYAFEEHKIVLSSRFINYFI